MRTGRGDISLKEGVISVRPQLLDHGMGRPELGQLKTAKSRRSVALPALAVAALARHRERLGHSQVSVTLDTYSHVAPSLQREAAGRIDGLLESGAGRAES